MSGDEYIDYMAMVIESSIGAYLDSVKDTGEEASLKDENDDLFINAKMLMDLTGKAREIALHTAEDEAEVATAILAQCIYDAVKILNNRTMDITPEDVFYDGDTE